MRAEARKPAPPLPVSRLLVATFHRDNLPTAMPGEVATTSSARKPPLQEGHTQHLRMTGGVAGAISGGLTVASVIVRMVHDLVRNAINDVSSWATPPGQGHHQHRPDSQEPEESAGQGQHPARRRRSDFRPHPRQVSKPNPTAHKGDGSCGETDRSGGRNKARAGGPFPDVQSMRGRPVDDILDIIPDDRIVCTQEKSMMELGSSPIVTASKSFLNQASLGLKIHYTRAHVFECQRTEKSTEFH